MSLAEAMNSHYLCAATAVKMCGSCCVLFQAAGGLSSDNSILETAKAECKQEASVPDEILKKLKPVGTVRWDRIHME